MATSTSTPHQQPQKPQPPPSPPTQTQPQPRQYRYLPTTEAYNLWSTVYDTDHNFLQAIDSLQLQALLPSLLSNIASASSSASSSSAAAASTADTDQPPTSPAPTIPPPPPPLIKIIDLGCGTGRGILLLHAAVASFTPPVELQVTGLDASEGMLAVCRRRLAGGLSAEELARTRVVRYEVLGDPVGSADESVALGPGLGPASAQAQAQAQPHLLLSTLVLEHIPLRTFFLTALRLLLPPHPLSPPPLLLLTNMHPTMGLTTQAGFHDPSTNTTNATNATTTIRPTSIIHTVEEVVKVAGEVGFVVRGGPWEVGVEGVVGVVGGTKEGEGVVGGTEEGEGVVGGTEEGVVGGTEEGAVGRGERGQGSQDGVEISEGTRERARRWVGRGNVWFGVLFEVAGGGGHADGGDGGGV